MYLQVYIGESGATMYIKGGVGIKSWTEGKRGGGEG